MQEQYKDATIVITAARSFMGLRWRSSCADKFLKDGCEAVEHLKLDLDYDTPKQVVRAGLLFSQQWVACGKPQPLTTLNE